MGVSGGIQNNMRTEPFEPIWDRLDSHVLYRSSIGPPIGDLQRFYMGLYRGEKIMRFVGIFGLIIGLFRRINDLN